ncbi:cache domain-containing sensor histidine kinase [Anaerocolumna sp. MB42-C2]|uniref:cache domain-containing sensor histidine kinase n=1 Tax=Anaerocolumna sp. MB42-C2 TaxID=3070997 RepID=UPI0027E212AB|nr:sensor histidine kinase [Anaerocolumna sp. MB42-C2]WMJ85513.1 sensor histidine kinase [Anaerocolumna sp. MB42-C2]
MKRKRRRFRFQLGAKYAFTCITLCLLITLFLTTLYYSYFNKKITDQTENYLINMSVQTSKQIEKSMIDVNEVLFCLQKENIVQNYLYAVNHDSYTDYQEYLAKQLLQKKVYDYILFDDNISHVCFVSESGKGAYFTKTAKLLQQDPSIKPQIYRAGGSPVWEGFDETRQYIRVAAQINSLLTMKPLGYVVLYVPRERIENNISGLSYVRNGNVFLVDNNSNIISCSSEDLVGKKMENRYLDYLNLAKTMKFQTISNDGYNEYIYYIRLQASGLTLLTSIPKVSYQNTIYDMRGFLLSVVLSVLSVGVIFAIVFAKSIGHNIRRLQRAMNEFGEGEFNIICTVKSSDEIGMLSQQFNMMVYNINDLMDRVYRETMLKQEAELKSLRMQINPHFLYNTLDTINWIAREKNIPQIGWIAKSLGDMMRYTINGTDFAYVKEEVENIHNYIKIQEVRYGTGLQFEELVDLSLYEYQIPKLIIQPLIENAIIHGLDGKEETGIVRIAGKMENEVLRFSVIDNGIGMEQKKIDQILTDNNELLGSERGAIGLKNVNQRLKLYYGEYHGLLIQSIVDVGTEVSFCIPLLSLNRVSDAKL